MTDTLRFFCVVHDSTGKLQGYDYHCGWQEGDSEDEALVSFVKSRGLNPASPSVFSCVCKVSSIQMARLDNMMDEHPDPWDCGFDLSMVATAPCPPTSSQRKAEYNASRIRWFMEDTTRIDPIDIDNVCSGGRIHPKPLITDGWHRYFATKLLGLETIPATYSGRTFLTT